MSAKCKAVPGTGNVCPPVLTCAACPALCPEALPVPSFSIAAQAPDGNAARILARSPGWFRSVGMLRKWEFKLFDSIQHYYKIL